MDRTEAAKRDAARQAFDLVEQDSVLGLGTGSTVEAGLDHLAARIAEGLRVTCIPSSRRTTAAAAERGIGVVDLAEVGQVDLCIDGADQIDRDHRMIKGGGGAHLREKCLARIARQRVYVADRGKLVERLGRTWLPLEILPYGAQFTLQAVARIVGTETRLRRGAYGPLRSDNGNLLADCWIDTLEDPAGLDRTLHAVPGLLETGLFVGFVDRLIVGDPDAAPIR
ncbi:ribose-5-phosphate isomerase [Tistlia consotensis]|uniref:Ribose-5-phosphate isomerase A n=1 Tax=Tistlia consotensis USBA 355 TaxID=560819 RepID=A0A1Y6CB87_9PROT|nr:ribose-5-phosphate isomerase RpiA [Tistlia consotensis]SMF46650.1 ribose-5-phosphate isomerase [Tistlia consotensis USBA 355]SNR78193.1 ribose-5-phosphate isomerase [Tistlia consotensis]